MNLASNFVSNLTFAHPYHCVLFEHKIHKASVLGKGIIGIFTHQELEWSELTMSGVWIICHKSVIDSEPFVSHWICMGWGSIAGCLLLTNHTFCFFSAGCRRFNHPNTEGGGSGRGGVGSGRGGVGLLEGEGVWQRGRGSGRGGGGVCLEGGWLHSKVWTNTHMNATGSKPLAAPRWPATQPSISQDQSHSAGKGNRLICLWQAKFVQILAPRQHNLNRLSWLNKNTRQH